MANLGKRVVIEESDDSSEEQFDETLGFGENKVRDWHNKQRVLVCTTRGITANKRHLMEDLMNFLAHAKKESKIEKHQVADQIKQMANMNSCSNLLFFEQKKYSTYVWMGKAPEGPSCNFRLENVTTAQDLKMIGNCLKFSRAVLSFDKNFDEEPQLQIYKEILTDAFGVPRNHPKTKPFVDHMFCFYWVDSRIWFRHYQLFRDTKLDRNLEDVELVEIGPRFSLNPIKIFSGFMGGEVIYSNKNFIPPMQQQKDLRLERAKKWIEKQESKVRKGRNARFVEKKDELEAVFDEIGKFERGEVDKLKFPSGKPAHEDDDEDEA